MMGPDPVPGGESLKVVADVVAVVRARAKKTANLVEE